jgi:REP element-mobilizing transposase RayT
MLVFHGQSSRSAKQVARRSYRRTSRCRGKNAQTFPFIIDAVVVLPDHMHAIWTLPPGDADFSLRWKLIKPRFARVLPNKNR